MHRNADRLARLCLGLAALAATSPDGAAQVMSWPNALSMEVDQSGTTPMIDLRVGPVAANAWVIFLGLPANPTNVQDFALTRTEGGTVVYTARAGADGYYQVQFPVSSVPRNLQIGTYSFSGGGIRWHGAFLPNPQVFDTPPMPGFAAPAIQVYPGRIEILRGPGTQDDEVVFTSRAVVDAIKRASPNDVIGINGDCTIGNGEAMWLGGAQDPNKPHHVHWGTTPMRFAMVGQTPDAKITGFMITRNVDSNGQVTAGIGDVVFANLTIESSRYGSSAIHGNKGKRFGRLRVYDCHFQAHPGAVAAGAYYGFGAKWWMRVPAIGSYDIRNCTFNPIQEHSIYVDSPQGDNFFTGIDHSASWRTAIQIVNRAWELPSPPQGSTPDQVNAWYANLIAQYENGTQQPAPTGKGRILMRDVTIRNLWGEGGYGITVAGFLGDVHLDGINAIDPDQFHGGIVFWTDAGIAHGVHAFTGADGGLYSCRRVFMRNIDIDLPRADRSHVAISGVEKVHILGFDIAGNRTAISLDTTFGSPNLRGMVAVVDGDVVRLPAGQDELIVNGRVNFWVGRPWAYAGFRAAGKISVWTNVLTNAQIDAMWP